MNKFYYILCISFFLLATETSHAQDYYNFNPSTMDVNNVTDEQIAQLLQQIEERGMSMEEALTLARAQGASEVQISQIKEKIREHQTNKNNASQVSNNLQIEEEEELLSKKVEIEASEEEKRVFGFHFFNSENLSFSASSNAPISDSYMIGIGDNIQINVYGASQQDYSLTVEKNRAILIPHVGPVYVGGLSLKEAKSLIKKRLSSIYSGLNGSSPTTYAAITLGQVQGMSVNVIGEVYAPGTYTLPAGATAFNALYLAGGPNTSGSFRQIDIIREGTIVQSIDVYKYIIDGNTQSNIQLNDQDVVLVRPYKNRVILEGEFKRVGLFETLDNETVEKIIHYAGGFTEKAYSHRIDLYRNNSRTKTFKDIARDEFSRVFLNNGDSIVAGVVIDRVENKVSINGAVYRPGDYELTPGMTLKELLQKAEGTKEEAFMERGLITRKDVDFSLKSLAFSVSNVLSGKETIQLQANDLITISSIFDMREGQIVQIEGEVRFPGTYAFSKDLNVKDLIFLAGGFKENADITNIEIARRLPYDETLQLKEQLLEAFQISVDKDLKIAPEDNHSLSPFDRVYVRNAPGFRNQGSIKVTGEVKSAGNYGIKSKVERISDIINRTGGLTKDAYAKGASLRRKFTLSEAEYTAKLEIAKQDSTMNEKDVKKENYAVIGIDLDHIMTNQKGDLDLFIEDGDQLYIPKIMQTVSVSGAVLNPVALTFDKKISLKKYINKSGGFGVEAKKNKVYVLYANGTAEATKGGFIRKYPRIEPGCQIIVPEKPMIDRSSNAQKWIGIAGGITGIATSIAAIISLSR